MRMAGLAAAGLEIPTFIIPTEGISIRITGFPKACVT
jgi:hypothetical protein